MASRSGKHDQGCACYVCLLARADKIVQGNDSMKSRIERSGSRMDRRNERLKERLENRAGQRNDDQPYRMVVFYEPGWDLSEGPNQIVAVPDKAPPDAVIEEVFRLFVREVLPDDIQGLSAVDERFLRQAFLTWVDTVNMRDRFAGGDMRVARLFVDYAKARMDEQRKAWAREKRAAAVEGLLKAQDAIFKKGAAAPPLVTKGGRRYSED